MSLVINEQKLTIDDRKNNRKYSSTDPIFVKQIGFLFDSFNINKELEVTLKEALSVDPEGVTGFLKEYIANNKITKESVEKIKDFVYENQIDSLKRVVDNKYLLLKEQVSTFDIDVEIEGKFNSKSNRGHTENLSNIEETDIEPFVSGIGNNYRIQVNQNTVNHEHKNRAMQLFYALFYILDYHYHYIAKGKTSNSVNPISVEYLDNLKYLLESFSISFHAFFNTEVTKFVEALNLLLQVVNNNITDYTNNNIYTYAIDSLHLLVKKVEPKGLTREDKKKGMAEAVVNIPSRRIILETIIQVNGLDAWQEDVIEKVQRRESICITGGTSGGKTFISLWFIAEIITMGDNILFIAPTETLCIQIYSNIKETFDKKLTVGIVTETLSIDPTFRDYNNNIINCQILVGTPKALHDHLFKSRGTSSKKMDDVLKDNINPRRFNVIIHDEIHTLSYSYDRTPEGKYRSFSSNKLLTLLPSVGRRQVIGMSATLNDRSFKQLQKLIKVRTDLTVERYNYTAEDIGRNRQGEYPNYRMKEFKKYIYTNTHTVQESNGVDTRNKGIVVSSETLNWLMKHIDERGESPNAMFFENEERTVNSFVQLIRFLDKKSDECIRWTEIKRKTDARSDVKNESFIEQINNALRLSLTDSMKKDIPVEGKTATILRDVKNLYPDVNFDGIDKISVDTYCLLVEAQKLINTKGGALFASNPYYSFIPVTSHEDYFALEKDGKPTPLGNLIRKQKLSNSYTGTIIDDILKGLKYGIGIITSTTLLALQMQILKIFKSRDSVIKFLFADNSISSGINLSFQSISIVLSDLGRISPTLYQQMRGRAGRRGYVNATNPSVYLVNVIDDGLEVLEDQRFDPFYNNRQTYASPWMLTKRETIEVTKKIVYLYLQNRIPQDKRQWYLSVANELIIKIDSPFLNRQISNSRAGIYVLKMIVREIYERFYKSDLSILDYISDIYQFLSEAELEFIKN